MDKYYNEYVTPWESLKFMEEEDHFLNVPNSSNNEFEFLQNSTNINKDEWNLVDFSNMSSSTLMKSCLVDTPSQPWSPVTKRYQIEPWIQPFIDCKVDCKEDEDMIEKQLDNIFVSWQRGSRQLAHRRDVVIKAILRGLKKYISSLFKAKNKKPLAITPKNSTNYKMKMIKHAVDLGLNSEKPFNTCFSEYEEFIIWMAQGKNTNKTKKLLKSDNDTISVYLDVVSSYSHTLAEKIFDNPHIKSLFKYFWTHGRTQFIQKQPENNRKVYDQMLCEMAYKFML